MRRILAVTLAISSLALLAGCAANPSLSSFTSSLAPFTLMVWLFAVSAIGLLTGCGGGESNNGTPNTFTGATTGSTTGSSSSGTTASTGSTSGTTTGSTSGTTTATQQNKLAFLVPTTVTSPPQALVTLPPIQVALEDPNGNILTGASGNVTLTLAAGAPAGAQLLGTLTQPAVNGVATFNDLKVTVAGNYSVTASCPNFLPATSPVVAVAPLDVSFKGRIDYAGYPVFGGFPFNGAGASVVTADLNADGNPDLIISGGASKDSIVTVMLGNADGTYGPPQNFPVHVPAPGPMVVARFHGDSNPFDVFVASVYSSSGVLLQGSGNGGFLPSQSHSGTYGTVQYLPDFTLKPHNVIAIATGDFEGDGSVDLAYVTGYADFYPPFYNPQEHGLVVLHGYNDGTFANNPIYATGLTSYGKNIRPVGLAVGDFNGDHHQDIAVVGSYKTGAYLDGVVETFLGDGASNFNETDKYVADNFVPTAVAAGALHGNTSPTDLVVGGIATSPSKNSYLPTYTAELQVLLGVNEPESSSRAPFTAGQLEVLPGTPSAITVADANNDGKPDVFALLPVARSLVEYLGTGSGTLDPQQISTIGAGQGEHPLFTRFRGPAPPNPNIQPNGRPFGLFLGNSVTVTLPKAGGFQAVTNNFPGNTISIVPGNADGTLVTPPTLSSDRAPFGLVSGDLNGDGIPDLVWEVYGSNSGYSGAGELMVALGTNTGTFTTPQALSLGRFVESKLALADFNGDGVADIGFVDSNKNFVVLKGQGNGSFNPSQAVVTSLGSSYIDAFAVSDLNGDHRADVVFSTSNSGTYLAFGNPDGTLTVNFTAVGGAAQDIALADVTHDGVTDVVEVEGNTITTLDGVLSNGAFTIGNSQTSSTVAFKSKGGRFLKVADFNGDGMLDVALVSGLYEAGLRSAASAQLLAGNNSGAFGAPQIYYLPNGFPMAVAVADINADGRADLVVTNGKYFGSNDVDIFLGGTNGFTPSTLNPVQLPGVGADPRGVVVADVNGDSKPDILTSDYLGDTVTVLLHN
jgi:hypothetical protein